jgi:hypothetical protein
MSNNNHIIKIKGIMIMNYNNNNPLVLRHVPKESGPKSAYEVI